MRRIEGVTFRSFVAFNLPSNFVDVMHIIRNCYSRKKAQRI